MGGMNLRGGCMAGWKDWMGEGGEVEEVKEVYEMTI